jgi:hypothetical protein
MMADILLLVDGLKRIISSGHEILIADVEYLACATHTPCLAALFIPNKVSHHPQSYLCYD